MFLNKSHVPTTCHISSRRSASPRTGWVASFEQFVLQQSCPTLWFPACISVALETVLCCKDIENVITIIFQVYSWLKCDGPVHDTGYKHPLIQRWKSIFAKKSESALSASRASHDQTKQATPNIWLVHWHYIERTGTINGLLGASSFPRRYVSFDNLGPQAWTLTLLPHKKISLQIYTDLKNGPGRWKKIWNQIIIWRFSSLQ